MGIKKITEANMASGEWGNTEPNIYVEHGGKFYRATKGQIAELIGEGVDFAELKKAVDAGVAADADFDEDASMLYLIDKDGARIGEGTSVVAGISGISMDTDVGDDGYTYLILTDSKGNELSRTQLPAGGGGSASTNVVKLKAEGSNVANVVSGRSASIAFNFTSLDDDVPTGDGVCEITVNNVKKASFSVKQGSTEVDVTSWLSAGTNTIRVKCTDVYGAFKILYFTISVIDLRITSTFDDSAFYSEAVPFKFTLFGEIEKTVHILLDGAEVYTETTTLTNRQSTVNLDIDGHGIHTLEAYVEAVVEGEQIESERLRYDVMFATDKGTDILIASVYDIDTVKQGELVSIPWSVYDPAALYADVELVVAAGGEVYSTQTVNVGRERQYWNVRSYPMGEVSFTIRCGNVEKTHTLTVTESDVTVEAVTNDMELYLTSAGRTNSELEPGKWEYEGITTTFQNVNWSSTGWVYDDNGDPVLRLAGGATAEIDFKPFANDWKAYGKTIEFEFSVHDINNRDAVVISCMDGGIGIELTAYKATLKSQQKEISCDYCEDKKVKVAFVVESRNEYRLMQIYMNGVLSVADQYPTSDIFQQDNPATIKIGSEYCGLDLYNIRSYTNALTFNEVKNNYIADIPDLGEKTSTYEYNDVYNEYGAVQYSKVREKIPVMTIIGDLPQSKGDKKNVVVRFENYEHPDLNYEDDAVLDVQGTSSQWYIRKNYKGKTEKEHQHAEGQMPSKVYCVKADYAEATGTHNTQNANLVGTLYSEKTPAQLVDERCRTTVYGYPIVIFHQKDENSTPEFIGKYNYNFDKGSEEVYGFDGSFDVESWEFLNNTSDACNFLTNIPENWVDDFEARYPDGSDDISRFKVMHDWVVSTIGDLDKFKAEFEQHFDLHFCLIYYVYTSAMLMVDQRAKNMFLTYWADTGKWQPWFYDNDTCLGINNEGRLVFDYWLEDIDTFEGANVYNGQNGVLWTNFREAFAEEIKACWQELRNSGKLTYEKIVEYFITNGSDKWSASIYNEDADYKYISMLRSDGDATNLYQVRGTGEFQLQYFARNRLNYYDSKWYASDYANNYVSLRIYTPSEYAAVEPNADITIVPFSHMYAGVRYKANGTLIQKRAAANEVVTFEAPDETFNDTETAIYGASEISSLGDLAPLYCGSINVSKASRLITLKVGDAAEGYSNKNLTELSVGTNRLLKVIDVRNCPNLTDPLGLSGCPNIEEIYAEGSGITGVDLPESGYLKVMHLPGTLINLTVRNQLFIEDLQIAGYEKLDTLNIENSPAVDVFDIMEKATNLKRVRLARVNWGFDDASTLLEINAKGYKGVDDNGNPIDYANISGKCHIKGLTGAEFAKIEESFPYLEISYDNLTSYLICMAGDRVTELHRQSVANGADGYSPLATGEISTPTLAATAQYTFQYAGGWTTDPDQIEGGTADPNAFRKVEGDRYIYPVFSTTIRKYTATFYNGSELLYTEENVPYGTVPTYGADTPQSPDGDAEDYPFVGWQPELGPITGNTKYTAVFGNPYELKEIEDDWAAIMAAVEDGTYRDKYSIGNYKPLNLGDQGVINMQIVQKDKEELADGTGTAALSWLAMGLLATSKRMNQSLVTNYEYPEVDAWRESDTEAGTWTSQNRYVMDTAEATWTIAAVTAGTLTIGYRTSSASYYNRLSLTINGEVIVSDYANTGLQEHTVQVVAGEVVTVEAAYRLDSSTSNYYATIAIGSTGEITIEAEVGTTTTEGNMIGYTEATGSIGGWEKTEMRTYLKETIKPLIEESIRNQMVEVQKTQTAYGTDGKSFSQETADDVWIPDYYEIYSTGCLYKLCYPDSASRIKKKPNGSADWYWLRRASHTSYFHAIYSDGSWYSNSAYYTYGIALGFCTGRTPS